MKPSDTVSTSLTSSSTGATSGLVSPYAIESNIKSHKIRSAKLKLIEERSGKSCSIPLLVDSCAVSRVFISWLIYIGRGKLSNWRCV
jgi:hypothetical protein